jgi:hypothetical protein
MLQSILFTLFLGIVFFIVGTTPYAVYVHPLVWYILGFYLFLSFLLHRLMEYGFREKRKKFVEFYLSGIILRLLLSVFFVGFFLYKEVADVKLFVITFFVLYIFYTSFEIFILYSNLRRD